MTDRPSIQLPRQLTVEDHIAIRQIVLHYSPVRPLRPAPGYPRDHQRHIITIGGPNDPCPALRLVHPAPVDR